MGGWGAICYRKEGSFLECGLIIVLIDKDGDLVYKDGSTYIIGASSFTLTSNTFTYKDLSIPLPTRTGYTPIERLYLGLGYPLSERESEYDIDIARTDFKELLQTLTMMVLKDEKLITSHFTHLKQRKYGEHIFNTYLHSVTGSGSISAKDKSIRWLNEEDTLQLRFRLFTTTGYQVKVRAMRFTPTEQTDVMMGKVLQLLYIIRFKDDTIVQEPLDFTLTIDKIQLIKLRDMMLLLSHCIGYSYGFVIRPRIIDHQYSRVYSVFTSISSKTRELLGFTNYDIGAAMQTICLQLVDIPSLYPLHQRLTEDKRSFRQSVLQETGKDLDWVKTELSKIDNLDKMPKKYKSYPVLRDYFDEAQELRHEVLTNAGEEVMLNARSVSKPQWIKIWMEQEKEYEFFIDGPKEASLYFFIWTQYEREIRHSMMSCFNSPEACHEVHDAVYSREKIALDVIEAHVLEETGFNVKISH